MSDLMEPVPLRVRLSTGAWKRLHERAELRSVPGHYADMIFQYLLHEPGPKQPVPLKISRMDDEEPVYIELAVARQTRVRLEAWSGGEQVSLATFCGALVEAFLERFERDPRDLAMMHYLGSRLRETQLLSASELHTAVRLCDVNTAARLPPGYFAKWIYARIRPLVERVTTTDASLELTTEMIQEMLDRE